MPVPVSKTNTDDYTGLVYQAVQQLLPAYFFDELQCFSTEEAAELLSCKKETVADYIRAGKLQASKPGKDYIITAGDLKQFIKENRVRAAVVNINYKLKNKVAI